jgi:Sigma-70, region 4
MQPGWNIRLVRAAIWNQRLSFPSQIPIFIHLHRADIQWRIVLLYFVHGWSSGKIAKRYGITRNRVGQLLRQWTSRAISLGYVDSIPPMTECIL